MGKILIGINLEFVRHQDKNFEWGVAKAAELGYDYVEPMVHWGRELLSEAGYFHSVSMLDDPFRIKRCCEKYGVKLSEDFGSKKTLGWLVPRSMAGQPSSVKRMGFDCGTQAVGVPLSTPPGRL